MPLKLTRLAPPIGTARCSLAGSIATPSSKSLLFSRIKPSAPVLSIAIPSLPEKKAALICFEFSTPDGITLSL